MPKHVKMDSWKHKRCPLNGTHGFVEVIEFTNRNGVKEMSVPRICLEHLKVAQYSPLPAKEYKTTWLSKEEKERIMKHKHTEVSKTAVS